MWKNRCENWVAFFFAFLSFGLNNSFAQTNDDCLMCHEDAFMTTTWQGKSISLFVNKAVLTGSVHKNLLCSKCHSDAAVAEFPHPEGLKAVECGSCHVGYQKIVNNDVHHKLLNLSADKAPTCKICHGTHNVTKPSEFADKAIAICGKCHAVDKLSAPYHTDDIVENNCLSCHKKKKYKSMLSKSVHAKLKCSNCHGYVINNLAEHRTKPVDEATKDCYLCHADIAAAHKESIHGLSLTEGIFEAAQCWDCHGAHDVYAVANDSSKVSVKNLPATCGKCHDNLALSHKYSFTVKNPGMMYSQSVHGKLSISGSKEAPSCMTCHGTHNIKSITQAESPISSINIPELCGKCHEKITKEYQESIHWIAVKKGVGQAPSCNDCHSDHNISAINTLDKRAEIKKIQEETCLQCHRNLLLSERYGMQGENAVSYQDSYHGLAANHGDTAAALCVDCHGIHNILPKYHKNSTIHPDNVTATCRKCHPDATEFFSKSYSHITDEDSSAGNIEDIVGNIYFWLIVIVIGCMFVHNLLILFYELKERYKKAKNEIRIPRFTTNELVQHTVLYVSFIVLAITGFQLKYPDSWWSEGLQYIGLSETVRQNIHRGSAVVMIALSFYHVIYLVITARGRDVLKGLLPRLSDITMAINNVLFYLRLRKKHPEFDNYNYIEKAEYWALIWGTIIMGLTGIVLWFPTIVGNWAPVWFIKVSEIIHFYEAILASLAIVFWHWFFVMFHPKEYPLSLTFIDGKMTVKHYKEEHKLKLRKVVKEWSEVKSGTRSEKKLSHFTKMFIASIKKAGMDVDEYFEKEFNNRDFNDGSDKEKK
ncbi:MAG: cytochrome b/b6 domain-containing protein [Bacteroidota bacterium]